MKFDQYFAFYMSLPTREQKVANRLPNYILALPKKRVHEEIRKQLYGTAYPRTSSFGRRLMSVRARSTARRLKRKPVPQRNTFSAMEM